ncbi:MAG: T9SS type A sorting domain-containing protein [Bacteroidales bacterium]|nr:T9SS type A sorting domain-containing protein [Bacteroidales bacterium]
MNTTSGVQMYTERPIYILGIAAPAYMEQARDTTIDDFHFGPMESIPSDCKILNTRDTTLAGRITDSMLLCKPAATPKWKLIPLASAGWRFDDPHRYIHLPPAALGHRKSGTYWTLACDYDDNYWVDSANLDTSVVVPLFEVMFEKPVVVEDSFVVAGKAMNNEGHVELESVPRNQAIRQLLWRWDHNPTRYIRFLTPVVAEDMHEAIAWWRLRKVRRWYRFGSHRLGVLHQGENHSSFFIVRSPMIFPIIDPLFDTTLCHEVSNVRVADRTDSSATLMWDSGDGGPWEVAFGNITDQWEDFTITRTSVPTLTVSGLEVGTQYFALVRGYCSVTEEYGDWSSPVEVEVYGHHDPPDPPIGIAGVGNEDRFVTLMPNPARSWVTVVSSYLPSRYEVYDMKGVKVLEQKAEGISAKLDLSGLEQGAYVLAVHLSHGVVTKRLVVRR